MKKLSFFCMLVFVFSLMAGSAFAQSYCQDVLEAGNPGGRTTVSKPAIRLTQKHLIRVILFPLTSGQPKYLSQLYQADLRCFTIQPR